MFNKYRNKQAKPGTVLGTHVANPKLAVKKVTKHIHLDSKPSEKG